MRPFYADLPVGQTPGDFSLDNRLYVTIRSHMGVGDRIWKALADPTRRGIVDALRDGPLTTGQLCAPFQMTRYAVMKHLRVLVDAELVLVRRRGRQRWNYLNAVPLQRVYERWVKRFEGHSASSLLRLKDQAEDRAGEWVMNSMGESIAISAATFEQQITINASREQVFEALTTDVAKWWAYRSSPEMVLEPWPGGRFYEGRSDGDGFLWGTVLEVRRPSVLRVSELLGSLESVRAGAHKYELEERSGSTLLKFSCQVLGEFDDEARSCLESGWSELLSMHLRHWIEKGVACPVPS